MSIQHWICLIFLGAIWGTSFVFNEVLIRELGALWVATARVGVGAIVCWMVCLATRTRVIVDKSHHRHFLVFGTLAYAIPFSLFPISQEYIASGVAAIVNAMTPLTTVIIAHFWRHGEKATATKGIGVLMGLLGVSILTLPSLSAGQSSELLAIAACWLATLCYAVALNYARIFQSLPPAVLAAYTLSYSAIVTAPFALFNHGIPQIKHTETWLSLLGIGVLATALAMQIMYWLLPKIGPTNFSAVTFIAPISTIILGFIFLDETLKTEHILGMVVIFLGLLFIDGKITRLFKRLNRG